MKKTFLFIIAVAVQSNYCQEKQAETLTYFDILPKHLREHVIDEITGFKSFRKKHFNSAFKDKMTDILAYDCPALPSFIYFFLRQQEKYGEYLHYCLIEALSWDAEQSFRYLLNCKGIDYNRLYRGHLPLVVAARVCAMKCIKILLEKPDIDLHAKDKWGRTAFDEPINSKVKQYLEEALQKKK